MKHKLTAVDVNKTTDAVDSHLRKLIIAIHPHKSTTNKEAYLLKFYSLFGEQSRRPLKPSFSNRLLPFFSLALTDARAWWGWYCAWGVWEGD